LLVEPLLHPVLGAFAGQGLGELLPDERILQPVRDGSAARRAQVDGAFVHDQLSRDAGPVNRMVVRTVPGEQAQRLLADAEMLVEPVSTELRAGYHAGRLVVLALDRFGVAVPPRRQAELGRPGVTVALAAEAYEHRGGCAR